MAEITVVPANVAASPASMVERGILGVAANVGDWLYLDGANGWKKALANAVATADAKALLIGGGILGTAYPIGANVELCFYGLVEWGSGMTPGGLVYVSPDTAGKGDQTLTSTSTEVPFIAGWAYSATQVFVAPQSAIGVAIV